jgi:hypothetical protein
MSIMQIAEERVVVSLIRGLQTPQIRERFIQSTEHDRRNPREEEVCQVFMLF